ncbi:MAG: tRNA uridine-5-carboxymethylaminomethyl(34) synthesis GTPase MnmE [Lautropia sp.]|nr:tRNA uridine-5-carboxymethylaminomethyl(34) synthesis GTPase MnmE [Lautropia sp.]
MQSSLHHVPGEGEGEGEGSDDGLPKTQPAGVHDRTNAQHREIASKRSLKPRTALYGPFLGADGQPIDYGLTLWFPAPHSYTGEHVLELQGHGGPVVQQLLLRRMMEVGANFAIRLAEPGEFTERAFLNDKLDLVQAEAVADLIEASTEQAARSATRSLQGVFSGQIDTLAEQLLHLRMLVEATLDFPEEEIEFLESANAAGQLDAIDATLRQLFATAKSGARLRQGLNVVLTGEPNVGKSSLLNALAGAEVAIVTPIAGTTRDRVIEQISIEGVPINLIDTAGLRDTDDVVERIGIERTWAEIERADVVVHLRAADEWVAVASQSGSTSTGSNQAGFTQPDADFSRDSASLNERQACSSHKQYASDPQSDQQRVDSQQMTPALSDLVSAIDQRVPSGTRRLTVINKIDLLSGSAGASTLGASGSEITSEEKAGTQTTARHAERQGGGSVAGEDTLYLSAKTGQGIEAFRQKLLDIAGFQPGAEGVFIARERHLQALQEALVHLANARSHLAQGDAALDLFAEELRLAHNALGRITGAVTADDLLGVIFSRFCIGK